MPTAEPMPEPSRAGKNCLALYTKFYTGRPGFVGGTKMFHQMCAKFINGERILEIGAGPTNKSSAFFASCGAVVGVDVSEKVLGNEWLTEAHVYDGGRLPFQDESFDACVSDYVLEHIQHPSERFREVGRVLKPGGVYCFRTPNLWHYVTLASRFSPHWVHLLLANKLRCLKDSADDPYPTVYAANTRGSIRRLTRSAGLEVTVLEAIEKEPWYGMASAALFFPMMAYERLVNSTSWLAAIRVNILCVVRKPSGMA